MAVEVRACPRLHRRQCILQGTLQSVEVEAEWGLCTHIETRANVALPPAGRLTKATAHAVFERGGPPDGDAEADEPEPWLQGLF